MEKLTTPQLKALLFIKDSLSKSGTIPTLRELCQHMGYSAIGSAQDVVSALRKKGFLMDQGKQAARSLVPTLAASDMMENLVDNRSRGQSDDHESDPWTLSIPCLGTVPAGNPVEAIEDHVGVLRISKSMLSTSDGKSKNLFALKAKGQSMVQAGIFDGDWLVVASQNSAPISSIVVARVDGDATVKRLMKDPQKGYFLKPENPEFKPTFAQDRPFEIVGRVLALQRIM
jgi:repressor LexA